MKLAGLIAVVLAVGGTYAVMGSSAVGTAPIVAQAVLVQAGAWHQQGMPPAPGTPTIGVQITGTPIAGNYRFAGLQDGSYRSSFTNGAGIYGGAIIRRSPTSLWSACASFVDTNNIGIAGSGAYASPHGDGFGGEFLLSGADFNCSGGSPMVGNPAYGGGANITLTISP